MEQIFLISCDCVCCTCIVSVGLMGCPGHHCSLSAGFVGYLSDKTEDPDRHIETANL